MSREALEEAVPLSKPHWGNGLVDKRVGVVGLGYVGLPLAVEFSKHFPTVGFDIDDTRIRELRDGHDRTMEVPDADLASANHLSLTSEVRDLASVNHFVVAVPTPIDPFKRPDLRPLIAASRTVGAALSRGDLVVYESTVYPGATEEVCIPELERFSGLKCDSEFFVGYSPERINPGDPLHRLPEIVKVTSGSTPESADRVDDLYRRVIPAGTHRAPSIRVAEAAKVIENTQRDVNIALINELSILFDLLGIDTQDVLEAAGTKWNFLPFAPGLVGGHCIGVDPYYLTHKAQEVGHYPEVILAGRRINDSMGAYVANKLVLLMARQRVSIGAAKVLVLGLAFKEDCPDLRNTRVVDIIGRLQEYGASVEVSDYLVNPKEAEREYGLSLVDFEQIESGGYDAVVLAVAHARYRDWGDSIRGFVRESGIVFDVKAALPKAVSDARL